jgi:hypothetical protein
MQVSNVSAGVSRHWEGEHSPRIQALGHLQKKDVISGYGFGRRAKRNGEKTNFGFRVCSIASGKKAPQLMRVLQVVVISRVEVG